MSYSDDQGSEVQNGTFDIFRAEGDVLYKHGEYNKALNSYNKALDLRPEDKNCLVARSQCYLQLGDSDAAFDDAEATLQDDPNFIKGILQKANALYSKGNFEYALVFYHRGNKLRPEVQDFRLGIQKSQEAIDNSIGNGSGVQLTSEGDLEYFYEQDEQKKGQQKKQGGYSKPVQKKEEKKERKRPPTSQRDSKSVKQLLGELYADKQYLEEVVKAIDTSDRKTDADMDIRDIAISCLDYLDTRTDFWQQQKPMYSRKRDQRMREGARSRASGGRKDPTNYVLNSLEKIDEAQVEGRFEDSLKLSKKTLKEVEKWSDDDLSNRQEVVANLHSSIGNAYLEMGNYDKALEHHNKDMEIAKQHDISEAKSRALDNLGRVHARMGKFEKAIEVWEEKLPLAKSPLEKTWLCHELGRCHLEKGRHEQARDYGEQSLTAAKEADDDVWKLNASVLIAQSEVKLGDLQAALEAFERSLDMAKLQSDKAAENAIKKAIDDVNQKIAKEVKEGAEKDEEGDEKKKEDS